MEHDRRVCPRCGEPTADYRFCESCRSHFESLTGISARAGASVRDPGQLAAQTPREAYGFEQASAEASNGDTDRITNDGLATAVHSKPEPCPAEDPTGAANAGTLDVAKLPTIGDQRLSDQPLRDVARLEEVLTILPAEAQRVDASTAPAKEVEPPTKEVEPPTRDLKSDSDWARLRQQVARLEQLLSMTSGSQTEDAPSNTAAQAEPQQVAARVLREAFWFEQAAAFRSNDAPAPRELEPEPEVAPVATPEHEPVEADPHPPAESYGSEPIIDQAPGQSWLAAACLLVLIGLVAVLTGRRLRA